jgi:hypothetical protein
MTYDFTDQLIINLIELIMVVGSALALFFRIGRITERFALIGLQQGKEISDLKTSIDKLSVLITDVALQKQRLDSMDARMERSARQIDELRHGSGYIHATE